MHSQISYILLRFMIHLPTRIESSSPKKWEIGKLEIIWMSSHFAHSFGVIEDGWSFVERSPLFGSRPFHGICAISSRQVVFGVQTLMFISIELRFSHLLFPASIILINPIRLDNPKIQLQNLKPKFSTVFKMICEFFQSC